ncbi:MAG: PTS sugar transporter subunit IIA [Planctomycetota bacterium]|jgi:mannitol/fructose-specific phosphotransferase system IIA component (Ntr-type)
MRLTEFLSPERVKVPLAGKTKEEVIRELLDLFSLPSPEAREDLFRAVMEREALMSTGIGNGIAIPHGILEGGQELQGALGVTCDPVDFQAIDGKPVRLVFLLISDETRPGRNMKALARIARLLHREEFRSNLSACGAAEDTWKVIEEEEAKHKI